MKAENIIPQRTACTLYLKINASDAKTRDFKLLKLDNNQPVEKYGN